MPQEILRRRIANAITEISTPPEKRSGARYAGPKAISDDPVQVVLDGNQGGLPVRERRHNSIVQTGKVSHDFEIFRVPSDEEWLMRGMTIVLNNSGGTPADSSYFRLYWTMPDMVEAARNEIVLVSAQVNDVPTALDAYGYMGNRNYLVDFDTYGYGGGNMFPIGERFGAGEAVGLTCAFSETVSIQVNTLFDVAPEGVYLAP